MATYGKSSVLAMLLAGIALFVQSYHAIAMRCSCNGKGPCVVNRMYNIGIKVIDGLRSFSRPEG